MNLKESSMSAARRLRLPLSRPEFSNAAHGVQERLRAFFASPGEQAAPKPSRAEGSAESPDSTSAFSEFVGRAVRIASIDLDRDPWWLYFRRRK